MTMRCNNSGPVCALAASVRSANSHPPGYCRSVKPNDHKRTTAHAVGLIWLLAGITILLNLEMTALGELPATLTTAAEISHLKRQEADLALPVKIRGVVTCIVTQHSAFVLQDATRGVFIRNEGEAPHVGELWEVEGITAKGSFAPIMLAKQKNFLGLGTLPAPITPNWDQIINGSLDDQLVRLRGVVESATYDPGGWSWIMLRMEGGVVRVDLPASDVTAEQLSRYKKNVVHIEGCFFARTDPETWRVRVDQVRVCSATISLEQPDLEDLFATPLKTAKELMMFDPRASTFRRVKLAGQLIHQRGDVYFVMDGDTGVRVIAAPDASLHSGDQVEAVGFPRLSAGAPALTEAVLRKTGNAPLPAPKPLSSEDMVNARHDATLVSMKGFLASARETQTGHVLEMQSGSWRFLARLNQISPVIRSLRLGSQLQLTGVYCAEVGSRSLGEDVAPIDLLLNSPADIKVLTTPPWWTRPRILAGAGLLALLLVAVLLWAVLLHRKVEERTAQLRVQIHSREHAEHQHAMEQERARIAHDLHDELGADITEIGMLATRVRAAASPAEERARCLDQLASRTGQMVSALEEIVWAMNPQHDSLASVVSYFSFHADRFLGLANIKVQMETAPGPAERAVDARVRHQLFLVFKEALANLVNHSGATEVRLHIQMEHGQLHVRIADNGRGLPATSPTAGHDGIANMRARVEKLGGHFAISSEPGRGTTVSFSAPLN